MTNASDRLCDVSRLVSMARRDVTTLKRLVSQVDGYAAQDLADRLAEQRLAPIAAMLQNDQPEPDYGDFRRYDDEPEAIIGHTNGKA